MEWKRSSWCHFEEPQCVEVAQSNDGVSVRDSKNVDQSPVLTVSADQWSAFVSTLDEFQT